MLPNLEFLQNLSDAEKENIITTAINDYAKIPSMTNKETTGTLLSLYRVPDLSLAAKWDATFNYLCTESNLQRNFYLVLMRIIAKTFYRTNRIAEALIIYNLLKNVDNEGYKEKVYLQMGLCHSGLNQHSEALLCFQKSNADLFTLNQNAADNALLSVLMSDQYLHILSARFNSIAAQNKYLLASSFENHINIGGELGVTPGLAIVSGSAVAGIAIACIGGLAGTTIGFFSAIPHGISRIISRKPINATQQNNMLEKLHKFSTSSPHVRHQLIDNVVDQYHKTRIFSAQSASSAALCRYLSDNHESDREACWKRIVAYMLSKDGNVLKNNGKQLFNLINNLLNNPLEPEMDDSNFPGMEL